MLVFHMPLSVSGTLLLKLEIQRAMLLKINLPENQKQKYMEVLTKDFTSSESSGEKELEDSLKDL